MPRKRSTPVSAREDGGTGRGSRGRRVGGRDPPQQKVSAGRARGGPIMLLRPAAARLLRLGLGRARARHGHSRSVPPARPGAARAGAARCGGAGASPGVAGAGASRAGRARCRSRGRSARVVRPGALCPPALFAWGSPSRASAALAGTSATGLFYLFSGTAPLSCGTGLTPLLSQEAGER